MNRTLRAACLAVLAALATTAVAAPAVGTRIANGETVVFVAVDAMQVQDNYLVLTGVVEGDAAPSTRFVNFQLSSSYATIAAPNLESCQRLALTAMERPGRYRLEVTQGRGGYVTPIESGCRLVRVQP